LSQKHYETEVHSECVSAGKTFTELYGPSDDEDDGVEVLEPCQHVEVAGTPNFTR
jgi:hypothetical protein